MNKQELIKHFEDMPYVSVSQMGKKSFIDLIEQLDEPQKPVVPKFVADWYEEHKENFDSQLWAEIYKFGTIEKSEFAKWVYKTKNSISTIVNMHQFGYTVEEKRYTVKIRSTKQPLFYNSLEKKLFFSLGELATQFTHKQLEEAGLGDVFNSPLFEVEEVEE